VDTENQQTTVDKRHTENQQTSNCGQTPHSKPTDKQLWTNVTQKTNRQTTVDKRHRNQQTNVVFVGSFFSIGFLFGVCPKLFACWFSV
jgi:hypothetical protein